MYCTQQNRNTELSDYTTLKCKTYSIQSSLMLSSSSHEVSYLDHPRHFTKYWAIWAGNYLKKLLSNKNIKWIFEDNGITINSNIEHKYYLPHKYNALPRVSPLRTHLNPLSSSSCSVCHTYWAKDQLSSSNEAFCRAFCSPFWLRLQRCASRHSRDLAKALETLSERAGAHGVQMDRNLWTCIEAVSNKTRNYHESLFLEAWYTKETPAQEMIMYL